MYYSVTQVLFKKWELENVAKNKNKKPKVLDSTVKVNTISLYFVSKVQNVH